jgi:basic membrane protein A
MTNFTRHFAALASAVATSALIAGAALADPAVLYDGGGKFDKGFNESAFNGATRWAQETGGTFGEVDLTGGDAQREQSLRQFAERGYEPILVPGFNWVSSLTTVAQEFPDTEFVIIDSFVDLPNVKSIEFKEQEGSYLVGVMAALASKTGTIGVIPAFNFELLEAFACGYKQGALSVNPNIKVLQNYVGTAFEAFKSYSDGKFVADHTILGVKEDGVGPAFDDNNASLITPEIKAAVDDATAKIISGEIQVHDFRSDKACPV